MRAIVETAYLQSIRSMSRSDKLFGVKLRCSAKILCSHDDRSDAEAREAFSRQRDTADRLLPRSARTARFKMVMVLVEVE